MAKHVIVKRRRKIRWSGALGTLFTLAVVFAFVSQITFKTTNQSIANEIEKVKRETATLKSQNDVLKSDVNELRNRNRIVTIAEQAGLESRNNTVVIKGE
ncbi:cell division protein FtsL [Erysipelothrix sp. HDW6A]|uniref:cell division protein FtsL n=1 Tax=Erysipelothrix sp. HDW6A TaxID=2714928 RepID=UPI00140D2314|nr:cell division protein FtsL [Erysipelothrix sp. HDW6A]QIK57334.1 cell division protein FtsL [Erysipelothrix sp. HDW6A]